MCSPGNEVIKVTGGHQRGQVTHRRPTATACFKGKPLGEFRWTAAVREMYGTAVLMSEGLPAGLAVALPNSACDRPLPNMAETVLRLISHQHEAPSLATVGITRVAASSATAIANRVVEANAMDVGLEMPLHTRP